MPTARRHNPRLVLPDLDALCPCGSGDGFGACCESHLPGSNIGKAIRDARRRDDKVAGLIAARADLCQWAVWHRTNTVPRMAAGQVAIGELVAADIVNLTDAAERVAELLELNGKGSEVGAMTERLRGHVDDPRWARRVAYVQARHAWKRGSPDAARTELAKLGRIDSRETDVDILRLHLGLTARLAPFAERLKLLDRVVALSEDLEDQLRHRGLKAALFLEHGDPAEAKRELETAVARVSPGDEDGLDWDETLLLIWCLTHLGLLGGHAEAFERATRLVHSELGRPGVTPIAESVLYKELGDVHRYARDPAHAEAAYRSALKRADSAPARIFLAEALIFQGRVAEARLELQPLERVVMEPEEQEDHLFVSAALAIHLGETKALKAASGRLRAWRGSAPYFEQRRLAFLVAVEDTLKQGANDTLMAKARRLLADPIAVFNRYIMLEPNIAGVGLRINNVLEDMGGPKHR